MDGCIAVRFVNLLRDNGAFTPEEGDEYIKVCPYIFVRSLVTGAHGFGGLQISTLNGLFVLGPSISFIGHHLDHKRLRAPLYRHPANDIFINMADLAQPRVLGKMKQSVFFANQCVIHTPVDVSTNPRSQDEQ